MCGLSPVVRGDFVAIGNESAIRSDLEHKTSSLYLDSISIFQPPPLPSLYHSTHVSVDSQQHKTLVEIVTTTPVPCSMDTVSELVWKELHNNRQYPDKWYQTVSSSAF